MSVKIYVSISGGCFQGAENVPKNRAIEVIDWDNLLGAAATAGEWKLFDTEAKQFIRGNYAEEYNLIQDRFGSNQGDTD